MSRSLFEYQKPGYRPANEFERQQFTRARAAGAKFGDALFFGELARVTSEDAGREYLLDDRTHRPCVERLQRLGLVRVVNDIIIPVGLRLLKAVR